MLSVGKVVVLISLLQYLAKNMALLVQKLRGEKNLFSANLRLKKVPMTIKLKRIALQIIFNTDRFWDTQ